MPQSTLRRLQLDSPIGTLTLVGSHEGVRRIYFAQLTDSDVQFLDVLPVDASHSVLMSAARQLGEYFSGERQVFDLPLDLVGTDFQRDTWHALAHIDYGTTATYGEQARFIGRPRAVRAVGGANRCNPVPIVLPCHRVIGADGKLTGFAGGLETKSWLLGHERAHVHGQDTPRKGQLLCN